MAKITVKKKTRFTNSTNLDQGIALVSDRYGIPKSTVWKPGETLEVEEVDAAVLRKLPKIFVEVAK